MANCLIMHIMLIVGGLYMSIKDMKKEDLELLSYKDITNKSLISSKHHIIVSYL